MILTKKDRRTRIKRRIAKKIRGTAERPRMSVYKSNTNMYVQFIDDESKKTLCFASLHSIEVKKKNYNNEDAKKLGKFAAQKCVKLGVEAILFDRSGYRYHGNIKSLAEGAREGGLKF